IASFPRTGQYGLNYGSAYVQADSTCPFFATSHADWITITWGNPGNGGTQFGYRVTDNPGTSPRTGTITVADQTLTVEQTASDLATCLFTLDSSSASFSEASGTGSVLVFRNYPYCVWPATATSDASWITITSIDTFGGGTGTAGQIGQVDY